MKNLEEVKKHIANHKRTYSGRSKTQKKHAL